MSTFYVTFGQQYRREPHPTFGGAHPDGWLAIEANDYEAAREAAFNWLGTAWSAIYDEFSFSSDFGYYPLGELHRIAAETVTR